MGEVMARRRKEVDIRDSELVRYDETFLLCRDIRHAWSIEGYWRDGATVRRKLHCLRCSTTRLDVWTPKGKRVRGSYSHPEGYRLGKGIRLEDVRAEELARIKVYENEEALLESLFE
jgi:hypothetical protein